MESVFDSLFFNILSGFNIAIAFVMLCYYGFNGRCWNKLARFGWLAMAGGLLAQSVTVVDHISFGDEFFMYFWAIKDIGGAAFVLGLLKAWSKRD